MNVAQTFVAVPEEEWRDMKRLMGEVRELLNEKKPKEWLSITEACELLHASRESVYRMRRNGLLSAATVGHMVYISRESIDNMLAANT